MAVGRGHRTAFQDMAFRGYGPDRGGLVTYDVRNLGEYAPDAIRHRNDPRSCVRDLYSAGVSGDRSIQVEGT